MKVCRHLCGSALAIVGFMLCSTFSVHADIRISERGTTTLANSHPTAWTRTIEIKGSKMRLEFGQGTQSRVTIYDLERGKRFRFTTSSSEVFELDLERISKRWKDRIVEKKMKKVIHDRGVASEVSGLPCNEYTFDFQAPISVDGREPNQIAHDSGTVCLSQSIVAGTEFANFVHEARQRGYVLVFAVLSPTFSPIGSYFFGEEPNVLVLSAVTKFGYENFPGAQKPKPDLIEETWTVTEVRSDSISDEHFRVQSDRKPKKDGEFEGAGFPQQISSSKAVIRKARSR